MDDSPTGPDWFPLEVNLRMVRSSLVGPKSESALFSSGWLASRGAS
jgi:hypothetical protein